MSAKRVTVAEAHDRLAELIDAAQRGDEVYIESENKAQVKLVVVAPPNPQRVLGAYRGKLRMHPDFDAPLSNDFWSSGRT